MPEATTRAAALLAGQVDLIEAPSPDTIPKLKSAGMQVVTNAYPHNWHYQLNFVEGPFKDKAVRQAANFAMNRREMAQGCEMRSGNRNGGMTSPIFGAALPAPTCSRRATSLSTASANGAS